LPLRRIRIQALVNRKKKAAGFIERRALRSSVSAYYLNPIILTCQDEMSNLLTVLIPLDP
jgi:hypothetical protein